jgi:hypothetical protein
LVATRKKKLLRKLPLLLMEGQSKREREETVR